MPLKKSAAIKQGDAARLFKAAIQAGFNTARIIIHPDGRIEAAGSFGEGDRNPEAKNTWDDVLK